MYHVGITSSIHVCMYCTVLYISLSYMDGHRTYYTQNPNKYYYTFTRCAETRHISSLSIYIYSYAPLFFIILFSFFFLLFRRCIETKINMEKKEEEEEENNNDNDRHRSGYTWFIYGI
ncbi:hypothetical protein K504DRAFT_170962 [Pleomassaria siparia CBS 279.74]|uniref:Uncharacterized protein n=1 Tax=Pleomassaria siparia CBS 279.74 TaxID=1314801 RepID=A0A6G1JTV6_9PLEO|nr:hypothetical protein K504DRAFT_170962 [Pleomassaria siparia CBS 279.74]